MRTQDEIVARIKKLAPSDPFGFESSALLSVLDFDHAKEFLRQECTADDWKPGEKLASQEILAYLGFAWEKANNCRGLSAHRSMSHMRAWLWLDGHTEHADSLFNHYQYYGKPCLVMISEMYGFDWKSHDNARWVNDEVSDPLSPASRCTIIQRMIELAKIAKH
jgi:hypothetical protein